MSNNDRKPSGFQWGMWLFFIAVIIIVVVVDLNKDSPSDPFPISKEQPAVKKKPKVQEEPKNFIPTQTITKPQKETCWKCKGSGDCDYCWGNGSFECMEHDTNRDGYCTNCENKGYFDCSRCTRGKCSVCNGKGHLITG